MGPTKQWHLTKREQDEMVEKFYPKLETETDKTVVLGEFIGGNEDVELSEDKENEVAEADDGADDKPPVANDINNTHWELTEEVLPQGRRFYHPMTLFQFCYINRNLAVWLMLLMNQSMLIFPHIDQGPTCTLLPRRPSNERQ